MNEEPVLSKNWVQNIPKNFWVAGVSLLILAGIAIYMLLTYKTQTANLPTAKVMYANLDPSVTATGVVDVDDSFSVKAPTNGQLIQVLVQPGTKVKAGTEIARLDGYNLASKNYETAKSKLEHLKQAAQIAQQKLDADHQQPSAQAALIKEDQAAVQLASAQVDASKKLLDDAQKAYDDSQKASVSQKQDATTGANNLKTALDQAQGNLDVNKAALEQAQEKLNADSLPTDQRTLLADQSDVIQANLAVEEAQLEVEKAQDDLKHSQMLAPIDGVVVSVDKKVGDTLIANDQICVVMPANPKHQIIGLASASVVSSIKAGNTVDISSNQFTGTFQGQVRFVSPVTITSQNSNVYQYQVYIDVKKLPDNIRSGMAVQLKIHVNQVQHVLTVPNEAIMEENSKRGVYVEGKNKASFEFKEIEVLASDDNHVEIKGLPQGTVVALKKP